MSASWGVHGPSLRFSECDAHQWRGSVLVGINGLPSVKPAVLVSDGGKKPRFEGVQIDCIGNTAWFRIPLEIPLQAAERSAHYFVDLGPEASSSQTWHRLVLPASHGHMRFGLWGGAAISSGRKAGEGWAGPKASWSALLQRHNEAPLHIILGAGGHINGDVVFKAAPFEAWLALPTRGEREAAPFTAEMAAAAADAYLRAYIDAFTQAQPVVADIPQLVVIDDLDIFTLFGAFHTSYQGCPVFQGLLSVATRFYMLFQHHTTEALAARNRDFVSPMNLSFVRQLGPGCAVAAIDGRSERTRECIATSPTWATVFEQIDALPETTQHLIVLLPTPPHWPKVPLADYAAVGSSKVQQWDSKNSIGGLLAKLHMTPAAPHLAQPSQDALLDDWSAAGHWQERRRMIEQLQGLAGQRDLRITFASGGTGAAAIAQFYSFPKALAPAHDFRWMASIVAPPLVDAPLSDSAARGLQLVSVSSQGVNPMTKEKLVRLFKDAQPTLAKILPRRGWVEVTYLPPGLPVQQPPPQPPQGTYSAGDAPFQADIAEKAALLMGKTTSLLKNSLKHVGKEKVPATAEEEKVVVLPHTPGCLVVKLHMQDPHMPLQFTYVVPSFDGSYAADGSPPFPPTHGRTLNGGAGSGAGGGTGGGTGGGGAVLYTATEPGFDKPGRTGQAPVPTSQQAHSAQSAALSGFPQVPVHTAHGQGQAAHAPAGTGPALGVAMPESGYIPFRQATVGEHRSPQQQQQQQAPISKPGTTGAPSSATVPSSTPSEGSKTSSASWQASGAATAAPWNTATSAAPPRQAPSQQAPSAGAGGADVQQKPKRSGLQSIASLSGVSKDYMSGEAPPLIPTSTAAQATTDDPFRMGGGGTPAGPTASSSQPEEKYWQPPTSPAGSFKLPTGSFGDGSGSSQLSSDQIYGAKPFEPHYVGQHLPDSSQGPGHSGAASYVPVPALEKVYSSRTGNSARPKLQPTAPPPQQGTQGVQQFGTFSTVYGSAPKSSSTAGVSPLRPLPDTSDTSRGAPPGGTNIFPRPQLQTQSQQQTGAGSQHFGTYSSVYGNAPKPNAPNSTAETGASHPPADASQGALLGGDGAEPQPQPQSQSQSQQQNDVNNKKTLDFLASLR